MLPLRLETCNASGWGPAQQWLDHTTARVVLLQENKQVTDVELENAKRWCTRGGWYAIFESAQLTEKFRASAGVAILVGSWIGQLGPTVHNVLARRRAIGELINLPGSPYVITVASAYLHDSEGLTPRNKRIRAAVGNEVQVQAHPMSLEATSTHHLGWSATTANSSRRYLGGC